MPDPGQLLREARRRHGVTQAQLATRARTSQAAISRIERGLVSPSVATLAYLLEMLNEELVLDAREVDWGHDRTLIRQNLSQRPEDRVVRQARWSRAMHEIRHAARA
jgi:transcriptional regulator with XRE-family HTH domain